MGTVGDRTHSAGFQTPSSIDSLELLKQAALTFQTPPAIYQRHRLGLEDLPKVGLPQPMQASTTVRLDRVCMTLGSSIPSQEGVQGGQMPEQVQRSCRCRIGGR